MRNLFIEKVEIRTEEDEDVKPYVEQTKLEGIKVALPPEYSTLIHALREIYNEKVTRLVEAGFLPKTAPDEDDAPRGQGDDPVQAEGRGHERGEQGIHLRFADQPGAGDHDPPRGRAPGDAGSGGP